MQIGHIEGATRVIGKSQGYLGLPIRDDIVDDVATGQKAPRMTTAWIPTPKEIEAILAGAPIYVELFGTGHPPIMLTVGPVPA